MAKALKHNIEVRCFVTLLHDDFIFHENIRVQLLCHAHDFDLVSDILENSELGDCPEVVIVDELVLKRRI